MKTVLQCRSTMERRRTRYAELRDLYLFGTEHGGRAVFNKVKTHIDQTVAYMYTPETVRFDVKFPIRYGPMYAERSDIMRQLMQELWTDSDADINFSHALTWGLVLGNYLLKSYWVNDEIRVGLLHPGNFGVYLESATMGDQEAVVQVYYMTKGQFRRTYGSLEGFIRAETSTPDNEQGTLDVPLWITESQTNIAGALTTTDVSAQDDYRAESITDVVEMTELWIYDDDIKNYRTVKMMGEYLVSDDVNVVFREPILPFVSVDPSPLPDYFWGQSEAALVADLQEWREGRMMQIRRIHDLQVKPPRVFSGMAMPEEKMASLYRPGAAVGSTMPGGKIDSLSPTVTPDLEAELGQIDAMIAEVTGITPLLAGTASGGGKSAAHTDALAMLAGSRIRKRVMDVERQLDQVATQCMLIYRQESIVKYASDKGEVFMLMDVPGDFQIVVASHSGSPLFKPSQMQAAEMLMLAGAIDKESLVEIVDPPLREEIIKRLKVAMLKEAQAVPPPKPAQAKQIEKDMKS